MTFPELEKIVLRTNESFRNKTQKAHHKGDIFKITRIKNKNNI